MPALPLVPFHLRINFEQTDITGLPVGSRIFWRYTGSAPQNPDCASFAGSIRTALDTNLVPLMASGDSEVGVTVTDLSSASPGRGTSTGTSTSSRAGGALPIGTAGVMSHTISRAYRGGKPRTYLQIGTSSDLNTQATWASAFITSANSAWAAIVSAINGLSSGGCTLASPANVGYYHGFTVVTSPTTGRARNVPTLLATPHVDDIGTSQLAQKLGSQRRRYGR